MNAPRSALSITTLRKQVSGGVLAPGDTGFAQAPQVWNARRQGTPAVIVRCQTPADVSAAIDFARTQGLPLAVKGGGHDFAGNGSGDGAVLVDLSLMASVEVDPVLRRARVEAGATWADVDHATQAHGLATPGATVSGVGVAGFTLGGGAGSLSRKFGLACDNLLAAELVTADGRLVRASAEEHPDLFWALRGGGGNFGVITSFELQLHDLGPEVLAGQVMHRFEDAVPVLRHYRDFMANAPDDLQCWAFLLRVPPLPFFPEDLHGQLMIDLFVCHAGAINDAEQALRPLREFGNPFLDTIAPQSYCELQQAFDAGMGKGHRWYSRSQYLGALDDSAIDTLLEQAEALPGDFTTVYLGAGGGAIARIDPAATAFPHRGNAFSLHVFPGWSDPCDDGDIMRWTRQLHRALAPHASGGVYVNMLAEDERDRVGEAYGGNYERLARVKREWDPDNLFRANHNITPAP